MSEEREEQQGGAPVEQPDATDTQVFEAAKRATEGSIVEPEVGPVIDAERAVIAPVNEPPSATQVESATEIFEAHAPHTGQTEIAAPAVEQAELPAERDGEIRISADHPMAALYMQTPMSPDVKGNRGAGVLIALLASVAFAVVYAGVLALWQAPNFGPRTFLDQGLLPWVLNWGFAAAVLGFFVALMLLVLIAGRAGWWMYVLGGFLVAVLVWGATVLGYAMSARFAGEVVSLHPYTLAVEFGLLFPVIIAGVVAREVTVWFGAWIGARGRRVKRENAQALVEYEKAMSEVQASQ